MEVCTTADDSPMDKAPWNAFMSEKIMSVTDARSTSYEWTAIQDAVKDAVKNADGDTTHDPQIYHHYLPYQDIRVALEKNLLNKDRKTACEWLAEKVGFLYYDCETFPIKKLQLPHGGLKKTLEQRTRKAVASYMA